MFFCSALFVGFGFFVPHDAAMITGAVCGAFHAVITAFSSGLSACSFKYSVEYKIRYKADEDTKVKFHVFTPFHPGLSPGVLRKATATVSGLNGNLNIRRPFLEAAHPERLNHFIRIIAVPDGIRTVSYTHLTLPTMAVV